MDSHSPEGLGPIALLAKLLSTDTKTISCHVVKTAALATTILALTAALQHHLASRNPPTDPVVASIISGSHPRANHIHVATTRIPDFKNATYTHSNNGYRKLDTLLGLSRSDPSRMLPSLEFDGNTDVIAAADKPASQHFEVWKDMAVICDRHFILVYTILPDGPILPDPLLLLDDPAVVTEPLVTDCIIIASAIFPIPSVTIFSLIPFFISVCKQSRATYQHGTRLTSVCTLAQKFYAMEGILADLHMLDAVLECPFSLPGSDGTVVSVTPAEVLKAHHWSKDTYHNKSSSYSAGKKVAACSWIDAPPDMEVASESAAMYRTYLTSDLHGKQEVHSIQSREPQWNLRKSPLTQKSNMQLS
ncbi:hypothetical protein C8R43DRAFT_1139650 [Mycena crocata]|nr:hypothetical protein C8R43DRAFT_1139650 [Mycena crocata]